MISIVVQTAEGKRVKASDSNAFAPMPVLAKSTGRSWAVGGTQKIDLK